jgi:stalled ribosome rescue protein Dom34
MFHAVIHIDHQHAQLLQFNAHEVHSDRIDSHRHITRRHGNDGQADAAFLGDVCDALTGIQEVLVTGSHQVLAELRHFIEKQRPQLAPHIAGYEVVGQLSPGQLLALARQFFVKHDRMSGVPTPT